MTKQERALQGVPEEFRGIAIEIAKLYGGSAPSLSAVRQAVELLQLPTMHFSNRLWREAHDEGVAEERERWGNLVGQEKVQ